MSDPLKQSKETNPQSFSQPQTSTEKVSVSLQFKPGTSTPQSTISASYSKGYQPNVSYQAGGTTPTPTNITFKQTVSKDYSSPTDQTDQQPLKNSGAALTINESRENLQVKFVLIAAEVDRLIVCNTASMREIDSWKVRYNDLERAKDLEIEQLKKELFSRQPFGAGTLTDNEKELAFLRQRKTELEDKTVLLASEIERLSIKNGALEQEILRLKSGISPKPNRVQISSRNGSPDRQDPEGLKKKYEQMESFYKKELEDQKARADHTLKTRVENEVRNALAKLEGDKAQVEAENRKLRQSINDLEDRNNVLQQELSRMGPFKGNPLAESDNRKLQQQLKDLETNNKFLQEEIKRLTLLAGKKPEPEKSQLESENQKLLQNIKNLETNNGLLQQEMQRLNQMIAKGPAPDKLQQPQTENQKVLENIKSLESKNAALQQEIQRLNQMIAKGPAPDKLQQLQSENQKLLENIKSLESKNAALEQEIQRLSQLNVGTSDNEKLGAQIENRKLKQQLKDYEDNIEVLQGEINRLHQLASKGFGGPRQEHVKSSGAPEADKDLQRLMNELQSEKKANEGKETNLTMLRIELTRLNGELDMLRKELGDKTKEIGDLKRELDENRRLSDLNKKPSSAEEEVRKLQAANRDLEKNLRDQGFELQNKQRELDSSKREADDKKRQLEEKKKELDEKNGELNEKKRELDEKKRELDALKRDAAYPNRNIPNPLADEEVKKLAAANRDLENRLRDLQRDANDVGPLRQKLNQLEQSNKKLEDETRDLRKQLKPFEPLPVEQERLRNLEVKVAAYEDICHYYRRRIDAYEKAFQKNNINPLLIKLLADTQDKPENKDLSRPSDLQEALINQNKSLERLVAEREGEVQAYKRRNTELENVLNRSEITKNPNWATIKECSKLKEQVIYQQQRIDQLIDMLLHHDIDIVTGRQKSPSEIEAEAKKKSLEENKKSLEENDDERIFQEEEEIIGNSRKDNGMMRNKKRGEREKKSGNNDSEQMIQTSQLDLLKEQFAKALQEKIDQERAEAADAIDKMKNAHEDEINALKNETFGDFEKRLRQDYDEKIKQLNKNFEREKKEYEDIIQKLRNDFAAFEKKLKEHLKDNDRLRYLLDEKQKEIERLQALNKIVQAENDAIQERARLIEKEHENLFDKRKLELEAHLKNLLESEKNEFMAQVEEERKQYDDKFKEYDRIVDELEDRNNQLMLENERLSELLQEKFEEIELWKSKYAILDTNRLAEIEDLKRRIDRAMQMETQIDALKAKLQEKDAIFILFFIEIERLYSINEQYEREVVQLREKDDEHVSKYNDIINKLNALDKAEAQVEREKLDLRRIIAELNEQLSKLEEKLKNALEENKRLRSLHEERKKEIDNLKIKLNGEEGGEIYTKDDIKRKDLEIKELINFYESEKEELNTYIKELQITLEFKSADIVRLNQLLSERKRENDDLKALVDESKKDINRGKNLEAQLNLKAEQYNQALKELTEMQREREHLQTELSEKNFQTSKKIHSLLQQLIASKALSEQAVEDFMNQHPSIGGSYPGQLKVGVSIK